MKVETLAEQLLFATLRVEANPNVGTGFIVNHEWTEGKTGTFLITNKHVVEGTKEGPTHIYNFRSNLGGVPPTNG